MSRATHDYECTNCGSKGKVLDDLVICPRCQHSIEGQAITGEALEALIQKIKSKSIQAPEASVVVTSKEKLG